MNLVNKCYLIFPQTNPNKSLFSHFALPFDGIISIFWTMTNWRRVRIWFYLKDRKTFSVAKKVLLTTWHVKSFEKTPNFLHKISFIFIKIPQILHFIFSEVKLILLSDFCKIIMKTYDFPGRFNDSKQSGNADMKKKDKKVLSSFTSRKVLLPPQNSSEERLRDFSTNFAAW